MLHHLIVLLSFQLDQGTDPSALAPELACHLCLVEQSLLPEERTDYRGC